MRVFTFPYWLSGVATDFSRLRGLLGKIHEGRLPGHPVHPHVLGDHAQPGMYWGLNKYSLCTPSLIVLRVIILTEMVDSSVEGS